MDACPRGPHPAKLACGAQGPRAPRKGLRPRSEARPLPGPYLVGRSQQPVDPSQLGAEREVLAEREQWRPAGLREVGAVERVRVVQELHPAGQRGHDASLPRGRGPRGQRGRGSGRRVAARRGGRSSARWLSGSRAPARRAAARAPAAGGGAGRGRGRRAPSFLSCSAPPSCVSPCTRSGCLDPRDPPPGRGPGESLAQCPQPHA